MRFFGFLYRRKKILPSFRSSVHPASNGQDLHCVKRAKIKEILGVVTPEECREVDELLNKNSCQVEPSHFGDGDAHDDGKEEDEGSVHDTDLTEKGEEKSNGTIAAVQHKGRSKSDLQVSMAEVELAVNRLGQSPLRSPHARAVEEFPIRKQGSMDATMKPHAWRVFPRKPGSADMTMNAKAFQAAAKTLPPHQSREEVASTRKPCGAMDSTTKMSGSVRKYRQVRPAKLTCVNDEAPALSHRNWLGTTSERSNGRYVDRIRRWQNASFHGSFPLPPPSTCEKHYLPTPQASTPEEVICVAHPLPQPQPLTPMRNANGCVLDQVDDRGQTQMARAITGEPLGKAQLRNKEFISVLHAKLSDPPKQLIAKQKAPQSTVGGCFPLPIQGLKGTPPTLPCLQSQQNPQAPQGTPSLTHYKRHQTFQGLQNASPTTLHLQTLQHPQGTLSTLMGMEPRQTPQSTSPTTPRAHHHSTHNALQSMPPTSPRPQSHQPHWKSLSTTTGPEFHPTPPITPPTTPRKQNHTADQLLQSTPPASPCPLGHKIPQNTLSTATGTKAHQASENTPPTTPRQEYHHILQNNSPTRQLNSLGLASVTSKLQSPPPTSRKPPKLTSSSRQSSTPFPPPYAQSAPCSPLSRSLCPRKWQKGVILGQGTFGAVHEGLNLEDGSFFAVKVSSREDTLPEIQQEVDVLKRLEHPNIVRYLGSSVQDNRLCIFLELATMGSLESLLRRYKRFEDDTVRSYTRQILLGLKYLHGKKTIHRDIKCGNILVDVNGQVKLSDFGIAKQVDQSLASSLKGTLLYMAPEVLMPLKNLKTSYSFPADIWSLGCTVFELADGRPPWSDLKGFGFFFKVRDGELPPMPANLSPEGQDFIRRCLQFHPEDRPTASELLQHPFVSNVPTPEPLIPLSPPSPLSPKLWQAAASPPNSSSWACGHCCPSPPLQDTCFDRVLGGSQRVQTLIQGREPEKLTSKTSVSKSLFINTSERLRPAWTPQSLMYIWRRAEQ